MSRILITLAGLLLCDTVANAQSLKQDHIRFDFRTERSPAEKDVITIHATLFNSRPDTVYFRSTSCDGTRRRLQYDRKKFCSFGVECFFAAPIILKIPPGGRFDFTSNMKVLDDSDNIRLGFHFIEVDNISENRRYRKRDWKGINIWGPVQSL